MTNPNPLSLLRILYVEDEAMTRDELSRFLRRRSPDLVTAENGSEALECFKNHPPDILITDLRMPDMDGLELTQHIRELGFDTPIIITSALSDSETILDAVDRGIIKYIVKPIDAQKLEQALISAAEDILSRKNRSALQKRLWSEEEKQSAERAIARDISALIKKSTGKGPKRLRAKLYLDNIQLDVEGMLTPMELTLLSGAQSPEALALNRELLYKTLFKDMHAIFSQHLSVEVVLESYSGRIRENRETLNFQVKRLQK